MASNEESDGERFEPATVDEPSGDEDSHSSHGSDVSEESEVARLLKQLQSSGAIIKKKTEILRCYTCEEDYLSWHELESHLIQHVSLPWVEVEKLPSDIESDGDNEMPSDDQWSDEEEQPERPASPENVKPDISAILKNTGITIKKSGDSAPSVGSTIGSPQKLTLPLDKLASLGNIVIKKPASVAVASSSSDIKVEPTTTISTSNSDLMQKLGKLGGIKLKLKQTSEGSQNSFKVINGVTATKVEDSQDEWNSEEEEEGTDKVNEEEGESEEQSLEEHSLEEQSLEEKSLEEKPVIITKSIPIQPASDKLTITEISTEDEASQPETMEKPSPTDEMSNVSVKTEVEIDSGGNTNNFPLFTNQIKSERSSPPPAVTTVGTPAITNIKRENDGGYQGNAAQVQAPNTPTGNLLQGNAMQVQAPNASAGNLFQGNAMQVQATNAPAGNLFPVLKKEKPSEEPVAIIEINGDSNDEDDDDCCVVSATSPPLRDVKPVIFPKTETPGSYPATTTSSYPPISTTQTQSTPILSSRLIVGSSAQTSTEKQHNFNWNAPDTKPEIIEKSADAIFASLLANKPRVESVQSSLEPVSEYISLDRLGSQHTCDVCNTRFTEISLLETHQRTTGHSKSIVAAPGSGMLLPASYGSSNALQSLSNLFPVKQLAEQVGKLSTVGTNSSGAFTHQQNVMINIQSFPGPMGQTVLVPPQPFSNYPGTQPGMTATGPYPNAATNPAYRMTGQPGAGPAYPSQYPNQTPNFHQPYPSNTQMPFGQESQMAYQANTSQPNAQYGMSSGSYTMPGQLGPGQYTQSPMGQMGSPQGAPALSLPGQAPSPGQYGPGSSPSANAGIKIQNIQTFSPGAGQQVRPAGPRGPVPGGPRGRAPGARPTIRPGIQVHGQAGRGGKPTGPRMPLKRAAGPPQAGPQKRRLDVLLPGRHDNEDCQVMSMQRQRDGLPTIQSVQGSRDKLGLGSQISVTRKSVNREANAMADVLAQRGIMVKAKTQAPVPRIPGLGSGVSIKRSSDGNFTIPEARVGGGMLACKVCKKMFSSPSSLSAHMLAAHPQYRPPSHRCEECPASYPKAAQLQHHRRVFHNVSGPERELGLPVVDLSQEENLRKLSELGIYSFIPLANREQASGCFGIPVISVHGSHNGMVSSLQALGADGLLSLGPLKPLPNS